MKRIHGLVLALICCFGFSAYAEKAQKVMIDQHGGIRIEVVDQPKVWRELTGAERTAYENPEMEVPADFKRGLPKRVDFFHIASVYEYREVFVFSGGKLNTIEKAGQIVGGQHFAWYVVILMLPVLFMATTNIAVLKQADKAAGLSAIVGGCVAFFVALVFVGRLIYVAANDLFGFVAPGFTDLYFLAAAAVATLITVAALAAGAVAIAVKEEKRKLYIACSVIYYLAAIAATAIAV